MVDSCVDSDAEGSNRADCHARHGAPLRGNPRLSALPGDAPCQPRGRVRRSRDLPSVRPGVPARPVRSATGCTVTYSKGRPAPPMEGPGALHQPARRLLGQASLATIRARMSRPATIWRCCVNPPFDQTVSRCWECGAPTTRPIQVTFRTLTRHLGALSICLACFRACYLPLRAGACPRVSSMGLLSTLEAEGDGSSVRC